MRERLGRIIRRCVRILLLVLAAGAPLPPPPPLPRPQTTEQHEDIGERSSEL